MKARSKLSEFNRDDEKPEDSSLILLQKSKSTYSGEKKAKIKKKPVKESTSLTKGNALKYKTPTDEKASRKVEHKSAQCSIAKTISETEMKLPEEIKRLLVNLTFLLHEIRQNSELKIHDELCCIISKIVTLLTELSRRPVKKSQGSEAKKPFDDVAEKLQIALEEHCGPHENEYEAIVKDIEDLERELLEKDSEVNYVKEQIVQERTRLYSSTDGLNDCLRNSILKNHSLKAEIKFNKAQFRKYSKLIQQKEQSQQSSFVELNNLRRKYAKAQMSVENGTKPAYVQKNVFHGDAYIGCAKSKIKKKTHVATTSQGMKRTIKKNK